MTRILIHWLILNVTLQASLIRESHGASSEATAAHSTSNSSFPPIEESCLSKNEYLKRAYRARVSLKAVIQQALGSKAKVILFGESHAEPSADFYKWAMSQLKKGNSRFDCVLIEQPKEKYSTLLKECRSRKKCDKKSLPVFSGIQEGLALGLKVFPVDVTANMRAADFLADVTRRNQAMSENVRTLFESGECHGAVLIVGSLHAHRDHRIEPLGDLLVARGLTNYRVELMSPGIDTSLRPDPRWIWTDKNGASVCKEVPGQIGANFAVFNGSDSKSVISYYGPFSDPGTDQREFSGYWGDYDATVLLGCEKVSPATCQPYFSQEYKLTNDQFLK
jgi:hypothetical protein